MFILQGWILTGGTWWLRPWKHSVQWGQIVVMFILHGWLDRWCLMTEANVILDDWVHESIACLSKTILACALCCSGRRRYHHEEETPEWFTGGPTSQNETIELRGFEREGEKVRKNRREEEEEEEAAEVDANEYPEEEKVPPAAVNEAGDAKEKANGASLSPRSFCQLLHLHFMLFVSFFFFYVYFFFLLACFGNYFWAESSSEFSSCL